MINLKNVALVKHRLLDISRAQKRPFQEILQYYGMERFLFRLSESEHKDRFILKGALLFKIWNIADSRATLDIDTLAMTSNSLDNLINIVGNICEYIPGIDDGLRFSSRSIKGEVMQTHREYEGARIRFEGNLGSAKVPMQIDIGFGDEVTPAPNNIQYPVLLEFPSPQLKSYPPEKHIAEKIHTMVDKGKSNTRIKDFYDVWILFKWPNLPMQNLGKAILNTFKKRNTKFQFLTFCSLLEEYSQLIHTQSLWSRFKQKELPYLDQGLTFTQVVEDIIDFLRKIDFDVSDNFQGRKA